MNEIINHLIMEKIDLSKSIVTNDPERAMELCLQAYDLATENHLELEKGHSLIGMAFVARTKSDRTALLDKSFQALEIFEGLGNTLGVIRAYNLIGVAYFYSSMFDEAIRYFLDCSKMLESFDDKNLSSSIYNNIGEVFRESELYNESLEYYERALVISKESDLPINQAIILGNMGEVHLLKGDLDMALDLFNESYRLLKDQNDMISIGEISNRIGKVHYLWGDISRARHFYRKALSHLEGIENQFYKIDVLQNIAEVTEDSFEKIEVLKDAFESAVNVGAKKKLCSIYLKISEQYEVISDFRTALNYHRKYCRINEEILTSNIRNKLEIMKIELKYLKDGEQFELIKRQLEKELEHYRNEIESTRKTNTVLEKEAYEDELTEIPNRRSINTYLKKLLKNYRGDKASIAVFMFDIDNFKKYNDNWGHSQGDACIRRIAEEVEKISLDREDLFGRYGGEEFVYISKISDYREAVELGERIRKSVKSIGLTYKEDGSGDKVTISVGGVVGNSAAFKGMAQVMEMADEQLYKAKNNGRDCTRVACISQIQE